MLIAGICFLVVVGYTFIIISLGDPATRLASALGDSALELSKSDNTELNFVYEPWGCSNFSDITLKKASLEIKGKWRSLSVKCAGDLHSSGTTYHLNYVEVAQNITKRVYTGEGLTLTLKKEDSKILVYP